MQKRYFLLISLLILILVWVFGPKAHFDSVETELPSIDLSIGELKTWLAETLPEGIRPDNQSKLYLQNDSAKTDYALLYLHGFSASPKEGDPVHIEFARRYGMNCYAPLLTGHGYDDVESFVDITPAALMKSAAEALKIASLIGERVIIMSTSTGSTLAVPLAVDHPELVAALLNFSPNFELADSKSKILTGPWGLSLARAFSGGKYREWYAPDSVELYWTNRYRLEGAVAVRALLDELMTDKQFQAFSQPVFTAYWYKNDTLCDQTISIPRIKEFDALVATRSGQKTTKAYSDVAAHCMISGLWSEDIKTVQKDIYAFVEHALDIQPK
ncbi:MAG: pimeloyl-ACP methyl ester carboxylesterase [Limisphaerales bacterium]|jgi:pimeloyl-ACP methyl ester carboxylesterase